MNGNASRRLRDYFAALQAADAEALNRLIGASTILENPFMNPRRLVGKNEIARAHGAIFEHVEALEFTPELLLGDDTNALTTGRLAFTRRGDSPREFAFGAAAECDAGGLRRLSLYCDTRNLRRWTDEAIL